MSQPAVSRYGWVLALLAIFALWLRVEGIGPQSLAQAAAEGPKEDSNATEPLKIGIVDVHEAMNGDKAMLEKVAHRNKLRDTYLSDQKRILEEMQRLYLAYKELDAKSDEALRLQRQLERMRVDVEDAKSKFEKEENVRDNQICADAYERLLRAADFVKKEKGLSIILNTYQPTFDATQSNEVFFRYYRTVVRFDHD